MAFVPVPKDMSKIKSRLLFNLSKRQLICFGVAALVGVPTYLLTRGTIGNSAAVLIMIGFMLPAFFIAMYEKDDQPAEKVLRNIIRSRWFYPPKRPYKTENFYQVIQKEAQIFECKNKTTITTRKTAIAKRSSSKKKQKRPTRNT